MTDHLPECGYSPGQPGFGGINSGIPSTQPYLAPSPCICDRLRACEQRVREEDQRSLIKYGVQMFMRGKQYGRPMGYTAGLDAAREAINKIPREDGGYCHVLHACDVEAAIDALR